MLIIRSVFGILYNFGFPYPTSLPFCGTSGIIMDSMAFTLLLWGACGNRFINRYKNMEDQGQWIEEYLFYNKPGCMEEMDDETACDED